MKAPAHQKWGTGQASGNMSWPRLVAINENGANCG